MTENKRRFERIPFDARVTLSIENNAATIEGHLHDISLKGALIALKKHNPDIRVGQSGTLTITPEQGDIEITLTVTVAYALTDHPYYGLDLTSIDIESAGHLRRLIEVNLGDEESLQRELANLVEAMEAQHLGS